jgi:hypothetical protein
MYEEAQSALEIENRQYKMKQGNVALKKNIEFSSGYM